MSKPSLDNILAVARKASSDGAHVLQNYFGRVRKVQEKPDSSIVSEADRESERVIRKSLLDAYPQFSFHGEEGGLSVAPGQNQGTWYVDPLDGTTNFVHGFPYFSTSVALEVGGEVVVAAVDAPALGISAWATRGGGAFWNGERIRVSTRESLEGTLLATGFATDKTQDFDKLVRVFAHFQKTSRGVRRPGAAVLDMCYTAAGVFDVFWERNLKPWDMASGVLFIQEAGGIVTTLEGETWSPKSESVIGGSPKIHKIMMSEIARLKS